MINWNPVFAIKDTMSNRIVDIALYALLCALFAPLRLSTFIFMFVLSLQTFFIQTRLADNIVKRVPAWQGMYMCVYVFNVFFSS